MGIKRLLMVFIIVSVVLGSIVFILFQTGADKQIIEATLPAVERRLGVTITYGDVSSALTNVTLSDVKILSPQDDKPLASIDRLGIRFRIGPLFFGKLDITGIRLDNLDLRMGSGAKGASSSSWAQFIQNLATQKASIPGAERGAENKTERPEIYIVSGKMTFDDNNIKARVKSWSGRLDSDGQASLEIDRYEILHRGRKSIDGEVLKTLYHTQTHRVAIRMDGPSFTLPASPEEIVAMVRDAKAVMAGFSPGANHVPPPGPSDKGSAGPGTEPSFLPDGITGFNAVITDANATLYDPDIPESRLIIAGISADVSTSEDHPLSIRANGGLSGTAARWSVSTQILSPNRSTITLEVPDMPLSTLGNLIYRSEHIRWDNGFADGKITFDFDQSHHQLTLTGQAGISGVTLEHHRLGPEPLVGLKLLGDFKISYDTESRTAHIERLLISKGLARATIRGDVFFDRSAFDLDMTVPSTACRHIKAAIPDGLIPQISDVELSGQLGMSLRLAIDKEDMDNVRLNINLDNRCRIADYGHLAEPDYFRRPFAYTAYTADEAPLRLVTGPGTDRWANLSSISPYVIGAVLTTEDSKFWHHSGATIPEIKRAIVLNLKNDSLSHGASTITMQLAKNLFLTRDRTLARKLQELFFVWYLETHFSKEEILELYLNVVEFGPSIYGIGDAAAYYFGRDPSELNAMESVFLVKLLPNPVARHGATYLQDKVSKRQKGIFQRVLRTMKDRGHLTGAELGEALTQNIYFYRDGDPLPEPRPMMRGFVRRSYANEPEYDDTDTSDLEQPSWD